MHHIVMSDYGNIEKILNKFIFILGIKRFGRLKNYSYICIQNLKVKLL